MRKIVAILKTAHTLCTHNVTYKSVSCWNTPTRQMDVCTFVDDTIITLNGHAVNSTERIVYTAQKGEIPLRQLYRNVLLSQTILELSRHGEEHSLRSYPMIRKSVTRGNKSNKERHASPHPIHQKSVIVNNIPRILKSFLHKLAHLWVSAHTLQQVYPGWVMSMCIDRCRKKNTPKEHQSNRTATESMS